MCYWRCARCGLVECLKFGVQSSEIIILLQCTSIRFVKYLRWYLHIKDCFCKVFSPNEINVHINLCQKIRQCFQKIMWGLEMNWTQESENVNYIICLHKKSLLNSNWYSVAKNLLRFCQVFYIQCVIIINRNGDLWSIESQFIVEFSVFLVRWPFISWYLEFLNSLPGLV